MADKPQITRYEVITPIGLDTDDYGNLLVLSSSGEVKVNKKHASLHPVFQIGKPVKIGYAVYMEKEYVQTAELASDALEPQNKPPNQQSGSNPPESTERQASIETQNAYSGVVQLMIGGIVKRDEPLGQAVMNYASSKLNKWYSQGEVPDDATTKIKPAVPTKLVTAEEVIKDLTTISKSGKMSKEDIKEAVAKLAGGVKGTTVEMVRSLPPEALAKLANQIKVLLPSKLVQEAQRLGATEIEPEDVPF